MELQSLLGDSLVKNDGQKVETSQLSTKTGAVLGLYFSAHWCPPCRMFTPKLASVYREIKEAGHDFEVVFISSDNSDSEFKSYHGEMPWLAIPYENDDSKEGCSKKFDIQGFPTLVLLDGATGDVIDSDGRSVVEQYGAAAFPFTKTSIEECKKEKQVQKEKALTEMGSLSFMGPLTTIETPKTELDVKDVTRSCESLALAFVSGGSDRGSTLVIPKLLDAQTTLGKDKLGLIFVPLEDMEEFDEELKSKMKDIPMVKSGEKAKEVVKRFETISPEIEAPYVMILALGTNDTFNLQAEDAARDIYFAGAEGFPWSSEALDALKEKEEARKEEMKSRQKDLAFFATENKSHVVDKNGDEIPVNTLQSKDVVGLYFSAHWCGPCRSFTPQLAKLYNKCKEQGKSFEVVFASSDRSEEEFKEYYGEMPWLSLSFKERSLKSSLSEIYEVKGIPTLVLLTGKGELITKDGRQAISSGVDGFPWK